MTSIQRYLTRVLLAATLTLAMPDGMAAVYTWQGHDLAFEVPDGAHFRRTTPSWFEMHWEDMVMTAQLYTRDNVAEKAIKEMLQRKALDYNMYDLNFGKMKLKHFKVHYIEGTMPDGSRGIIADLLSKKQNLVVEVTINYLYGNREVVDDIIKSFAHGKEPAKRKRHQRVQPKPKDDKKPAPQPTTPRHDDGPLYDA